MRVSRKPGLRIPRKTIRITGERTGKAYCKIGSEVYMSGIGAMELSLPVGAVITLCISTTGVGENAVIVVNDRMILETAGTVRYVVTEDATITFGFDTNYSYSIGVAEKEEKTIRFTFNGDAYIAKNGMDWYTWVNGQKYIDHFGNYQEEGFYKIGSSGAQVKYNPGYTLTTAYRVITASGDYVYGDDEIIDGHAYDYTSPDE